MSEVEWLEECESTQDLAWQLSPTFPHGHFVVARRQTRGRGRGPGREWVSGPGGLYLSWRWDVDNPAGISLLGGLAVILALRDFGVEAWLKWPNDVWVGRAKIAGVLPDCRWKGSQCAGLVLGIGVNVAQSLQELPPESVSMAALGVITTPEAFFEVLREKLLQLADQHKRHGLAGYLEEVRRHSLPLGTPITYVVEGVEHRDFAEGLDEEGFLRLRSGGVLRSVERLLVGVHLDL